MALIRFKKAKPKLWQTRVSGNPNSGKPGFQETGNPSEFYYFINFCTQSPKLKTAGIASYENQFWNPGFTNGLRQFGGYEYLILFSFFVFSIFTNLWNQIYTNVKTPKRKLGRFVNDTLLNFGLRYIHNLRTFQLGVTSFLGTGQSVKKRQPFS